MKSLYSYFKRTTRWSSIFLVLGIFLIGFSATRCGNKKITEAELPELDAIDYDALRRYVSSDTPPSDTLKLPGMTVWYIGQGKITDERVIEPNPDSVRDLQIREIQNPQEPEIGKAETNSQKWIFFNAENQQEFEIEFSGDLLKAVRQRRNHGNTGAGSRGKEIEEILNDTLKSGGMGLINVPKGHWGQDRNEPQAILAGWSRGVDSRRNYSTFNTRYPWRTVSHLSNGCSGTFIGPQHVITAAHCVYNRNTESWYTFEVIPGRSGADRPFGETNMDASVNPRGTWVWYFTPAGFRDPDDDNNDYSPDDIAIIITPDRLGETVGWMGRAAWTGSVLEELVHFNHGYPGCGLSESPENCVSRTLYGDINDCELNSYSNPNSDGWNRVIRMSCDAGRGHSGSPMYYLFEDPIRGTIGAVTAVAFWQNCTTCNDNQVFVNRVRRITPSELDIIDLFYSWTGD